jgi:hypothetical protein
LGASTPPLVIVVFSDGSTRSFSDDFQIGRDAPCEIQIDDLRVSRRHAAVTWARNHWVIRDLHSGNGLFVNGRRVASAALEGTVIVTLGTGGPQIRITSEAHLNQQRGTADAEQLKKYADRYLTSKHDSSASDKTIMIRKAYEQLQQHQRRTTGLVVGVLSVLLVCALGYAVYAHVLMTRYRREAENRFHEMKAAEVQSLTGGDSAEARDSRRRRAELEQDYNKYIQRLYDKGLNEKDRLILHVTRIFGECEISAPPEYMREVNRRIREWQSTSKFADAVNRANRLGYTETIVREFRALELPPQYFYLALQESSFNERAIGDPTRWGHAKGMWQFIADTAQTYGLRLGPNPKSRAFEPEDERFNWARSTVAAARYIRKIYSTDAQASGLLVMASYNWGEGRVINRLQKMPADPTQRNFWNLLRNYPEDVPDQTRDYVFRIVAAAVIGENPALFKIPIENPLKRFDPAAGAQP